MSEFQNPNQGPGMERQLLLVFALTFVILIAFQPFLSKYMHKQGPEPQPAAPAPASTPAPALPASPTAATAAAGAIQAASEADVIVENDLYRIVFTNRGAQVKSWVLKKFSDDKGRPLELVGGNAQLAMQKDGQVSFQPAVQKYGYPMSLWTYDEGLRTRLNSALYLASANGVLKTPATLTYEYADGDLTVRKSFHFDESYLIHVDSQVLSHGQPMQAYPSWPASFGDQVATTSYAAQRLSHTYGDKTTRIDVKKVSGGSTIAGPFNWAGVADQYFGAVFLPDKPDSVTMVALSSGAVIPKNPESGDMRETQPVTLLGTAVGNPTGPTQGRWFVGPKAVDVVDNIRSTPADGQGVGPNLSGLIDFGMFGWVGKPLFMALKWMQQHIVRNWGWAIVLITVLINAALLPLRITSMKSALKMQKIQPLINDIKKKYEKIPMRDPRRQEMNTEIGSLFKEQGVNPAGGCLPMLIQMPFLWAFYTMLTAAIELRHAQWMWIKDLSSPDPHHVLPIFIIVSTWGMQKMTPTPGMDPAQAKMMNLMMPVMLGIFSWAVAAGLGLYWLVGTVIAIVTQQALNRTSLGQEMRSIAEKRARRKASRA